MGKTKTKPKTLTTEEEQEQEQEEAKGGKGDIFQLIFGGDSNEGPGLGLVGIASNPRNGETDVDDVSEVKKKKKKKEKKRRENDSGDDEKTDSVDQGSEDVVVVKAKKRKSDVETTIPSLDVDDDEEEGKKRKKKKKKKDKGGIVDLDVDVGLIGKEEVKRSKKDKDKEFNGDIASIEKTTKGNDDDEIVEGGGEKKKKKKRKRDEIEEEYEAKLYGVDAIAVGKEGGDVGKRVVGEKRKTLDDPSELMVSKDGFDDESKLLRTVFVGNLPLKTKKKALLKEFSGFGEIESLRIRSVPIMDSKIPRKGAIIQGKINEAVDSVHAYIVFKDEESAKASLSHNMAMVGGNHVRVDMACPPRKKLKGDSSALYDSKRTVFVGNLPFDVKDEELYQLFCGINQLESSIEAVRVIRDPHTSLGKGIAYVLLKTTEAASLLVKRRHLKLRDRDLRLYHAKSESTLSKKRSLSVSSANHSSSKRLHVASGGDAFDNNKGKAKATLSYQGLRASKSGVQKKEGSHKRTGERGMQKSKTDGGSERKARSGKRPSVAARKAKTLNLAGTPKQTGIKRKSESRTPDSSYRKKKIRKFK